MPRDKKYQMQGKLQEGGDWITEHLTSLVAFLRVVTLKKKKALQRCIKLDAQKEGTGLT